jgi:Arc/MetJ-type ribon-helix-helix transcriptional regulator
MTQMVARLDDALAAQVDELVALGVVGSRSEAIRMGLERLVDEHRRAQIGREIVRGFEAIPQRDDDMNWADEATIAMIAEEPW